MEATGEQTPKQDGIRVGLGTSEGRRGAQGRWLGSLAVADSSTVPVDREAAGAWLFCAGGLEPGMGLR